MLAATVGIGQGSVDVLEGWIVGFGGAEDGVGGPMRPASDADEEGGRWGCMAGDAVAEASGGLLCTGDGFVTVCCVGAGGGMF